MPWYCPCDVDKHFKTKRNLSEHKLRRHIPIILRIQSSCWQCGRFISRNRINNHLKKCPQNFNPTEFQKLHYYQHLIQTLVNDLINFVNATDLFGLLAYLDYHPNQVYPSIDFSKDLTPPPHFLNPLISTYNSTYHTIHWLTSPQTFFKLFKIVTDPTINIGKTPHQIQLLIQKLDNDFYSLLAYNDRVGNAERVYSMLQNCIGLMEENILQMGPSLQLGAPPPDLGRQRISALNPQDAPYIPEDFIPV